MISGSRDRTLLGWARRDMARERSMHAELDQSAANLDDWLSAEQFSPSQGPSVTSGPTRQANSKDKVIVVALSPAFEGLISGRGDFHLERAQLLQERWGVIQGRSEGAGPARATARWLKSFFGRHQKQSVKWASFEVLDRVYRIGAEALTTALAERKNGERWVNFKRHST
jgi:hypothetical protein